jgi:GT2 family glycosyltransferase
VLVCTRGRGSLVTQCVRTILAALGTDDELLVVDADPPGESGPPMQPDDPRCRWISAPQPGKSRQLNLGIREARNDILVITDDDCMVAPGWIAGMAHSFLEGDVGIAFGRVEGLTRLSGPRPETPLPGPARRDMWRFSHGAAMAVRRQAALQAGGFDERLGPGTPLHGEEADLLLRIESAGWRCFVADAPPVQHVEWRTAAEDLRNLVVYERGGGAWVGAAIRRGSPSAAGPVITRLRYQCGHLQTPGVFTLRAEIAFCSGLAAGLRLRPRRFLHGTEDQSAARPASEPGIGLTGSRPVESFPWPSVTGRRCLCLTEDERVPEELERRQASEVTILRPAEAAVEDLTAGKLGRFDLVVAHDLAGAKEPGRWLGALAAVCDSHLMSIERIHLGLTLLGRGHPYVARDRRQEQRLVMNGAAHRRLLEAADLQIQLLARPWIVHESGGQRYAERAILTRPANSRAAGDEALTQDDSDA